MFAAAPFVFPPSTQHQEQQQSLLDAHRYGKWLPSNSVAFSATETGTERTLATARRQRQYGSGKRQHT